MSGSEVIEFRKLLGDAWGELSSTQQDKVVQFYALVLEENQKQNLTRLVSPKDFLEGHVLDVRALLNSGLASFPAMDLGSGAGVPGLLSAVLDEKQWILAESEGRKAGFLTEATKALELNGVEVFAGRGEEFLKKNQALSIVARAVGPVERIYVWLRGCSTWNNLVLFKGPGWDAEWASFQQSKYKKELEIDSEFAYSIGNPPKNLRIVRLKRVRKAKG